MKALHFEFPGTRYTYTWFEDAAEYIAGQPPYHGSVHRVYSGDVVARDRFHVPGAKQWDGLDIAANFIERGLAVEVDAEETEVTKERTIQEMFEGLPILDPDNAA